MSLTAHVPQTTGGMLTGHRMSMHIQTVSGEHSSHFRNKTNLLPEWNYVTLYFVKGKNQNHER